MTILCIETSTSVCSAAICQDGMPLKQCICREGSNHARLLPLYIEELLAYVQQEGIGIDAVALSEGPGSYTGLRIGTSTAKGLCYGLNIPLIPIPTLEVLCAAARQQKGEAIGEGSVLVPMIDARRMEVYTAICGETKAVVVESEESLTKDQGEVEKHAAAYYYFGDGAAKCQPVLQADNWHFVPGIVPEAQYMGGLVESRKSKVESGKMVSGAELAYYEPFYLKEFIAAQSHVKGLK